MFNMVIDWLIVIECGVIGLFKVFGYFNWEVGWYYIKMVLVIVGFGILFGLVFGVGFGYMFLRIYVDFFIFLFLVF